jgi:hypothetical protein
MRRSARVSPLLVGDNEIMRGAAGGFAASLWLLRPCLATGLPCGDAARVGYSGVRFVSLARYLALRPRGLPATAPGGC